MEPEKTNSQAAMPSLSPSNINGEKKEKSATDKGAVSTQQIPLIPATAAREKQFRQGKRLAMLGLVLLLCWLVFFVPARRLPGIGFFMGFMGFDDSDADLMSFGRAFFTWVGEGFSSSRVAARMNGEYGQELSIFDRQAREGFSASGPRSGLIDWAAVNASRRARGLKADAVQGAYRGLDQEEDRAALNREAKGWSDEARQAMEQASGKTEIFFGADGDQLARAAAENKDNQGSADSFRLVAKKNRGLVIGAAQTDWLALAVDKARELGIDDLEKELEKIKSRNAPLSALGGNLTADSKEKQDLARIWLLSKVANKAKQLMLKKQLAGAGYLAIEMPKKVYDSAGMGAGIMMNGNEIMADFQETNKLLLGEEECRKLAAEASGHFRTSIESAGQIVDNMAANPPQNCETTSFKTQMETMDKNCQERQEYLGGLKGSCDRNYVTSKQDCKASGTAVGTYIVQYEGYCTAMNDAEKAWQDAQQAEAAAKDALDKADPNSPEYTQLKQAYEQAQENTNQKKTKYDEAVDKVKEEDTKNKNPEEWGGKLINSFGQDSGYFPSEDTDSIKMGW